MLARYSESVWLKGGLNKRQFVDHIVDTLGDGAAENPSSSSDRTIL
jgi:hypothetical protein